MKIDAWVVGFSVGYGDWMDVDHYLDDNEDQAHLFIMPEFHDGFKQGKAQIKIERLERLLTHA